MKKEYGITLTSLIITVIVLTIISGIAITSAIDTYSDSEVIRFQTYMKFIQKKVDIFVEEGNFQGQTLTIEQQNVLQTIIDNDTKGDIETELATEETLRYFSSDDIEQIFGVEDVNDEVVVNFSNREVISLNGIEKDGKIYYVESAIE